MNIYAVSKLVRRPPSLWMSTLRSMERGREIMRAQYTPLKQAIVEDLEKPGTGTEQLRTRLFSEEPTTPAAASVRERSLAAFAVFQERFRPRIARLLENYTSPDYQPAPVEFHGHLLEGRFHMAIETPRGETKYVYLHASEWSSEVIEPFLELLAVIAEKRHGADRSAVWFFHLGKGQILTPKKAFRKTRKDLEKVISLLELIDHAVHGDYEAA